MSELVVRFHNITGFNVLSVVANRRIKNEMTHDISSGSAKVFYKVNNNESQNESSPIRGRKKQKLCK